MVGYRRYVTGPLAGVRVVEIVGLGPGPFAAMHLADLGANVIGVDRPGGNALRSAPLGRDLLERGRPRVELDLKSPEGVETVLRLVERADILIEGFRPGIMERLGLGPAACLARNPQLVFGRLTGWGQDGPLAQTAGHDVNYIALAGALDPIGPPERPAIPLNIVGDFAGGSLYLVTGVLAALTHARATGEGQVVDAAIVDGVAHLMAMAVSMQQAGTWDGARGTFVVGGGVPFYDVYETADGRWMSVGALEDQFWSTMADLLGTELPDRTDPDNWPALREALRAVFATRTQAEWSAVFDGSDACVVPVRPLADAYCDPHLIARGTYVERGGSMQPAPAPRFSATPAELRNASREALEDWGL